MLLTPNKNSDPMPNIFSSQWEPFLSEQDMEILRVSHYGRKLPLPKRPALVVIDMTYDFCGVPGMDAVSAATERRTACGPSAWQAVPLIARVLTAARQAKMPIAYSRRSAMRLRRKSPKTARATEDAKPFSAAEDGNSIITELAPDTPDLVFGKGAPSIFFETEFPAWFTGHECDGLFIVGCTTSGCVRASAVDAFSRQINSFIIADAVFDRFSASHKIALFDCQAKYADLISTADFESHCR
jgi:maleamate amidohydrolase